MSSITQAPASVIDEPLARVIESIDIPAEAIQATLDRFADVLAMSDPARFNALKQGGANPHFAGQVMGYCVIAMALSALAEILDTDDRFNQATRYLLREEAFTSDQDGVAAQLVRFAFNEDAALMTADHPFFGRRLAVEAFLGSHA